jgi:hypothetical protein
VFDVLIAKTESSVCSICHGKIEMNSEYVRQGYDGRHSTCHEGLSAAIDKAAEAFIVKARTESKKAGKLVAYPTDAEQRVLYGIAKKAGTLDVVVSTKRAKKEEKAPPKAGKAEGKAPPKAEKDPAEAWDKKKAQLDKALDVKRLSQEQYDDAMKNLGERPGGPKVEVEAEGVEAEGSAPSVEEKATEPVAS